MKNEIHVYHHQVRPRPKKKKYEPFWKGMGKLALKEAASVGSLIAKEAADVGERAAYAMVLQEPPKKKKKR
ncbi:MAG: hypothetical protein AAFQ10_03885 [Pseudomonadota bacterium]